MIFDYNVLNIILLLLLFKIFYDYNKGNVEKFDMKRPRGFPILASGMLSEQIKQSSETLQQKENIKTKMVITGMDTDIEYQTFRKAYSNGAKILFPEDITDINKMVNKNVFTDIQTIKMENNTDVVHSSKGALQRDIKYPIFAPLPSIRYVPINKVGPFKVLDNIDYYKQIDIN